MNCREGFISWDAVTQISKQSRWEFIMDSVHFSKADIYIGFYELFTEDLF
jgi:hypothetical protein